SKLLAGSPLQFQGDNSPKNHSLPRSPSTTSWKSRLRRLAHAEKLSLVANSPALSIDPHSLPSSTTSSYPTPVSAGVDPIPPVAGIIERTSDNSSNTQSSDSNSPHRCEADAHDLRYLYPSLSPTEVPTHNNFHTQIRPERGQHPMSR